jgi:hypothetical protein
MTPDGDMLITMRYSNQIRRIHDGVLDPKPVEGLPPMRRMFDLVLHPPRTSWCTSDTRNPVPMRERQWASLRRSTTTAR